MRPLKRFGAGWPALGSLGSLLILHGVLCAGSALSAPPLTDLSAAELERKLEDIDRELGELAHYSPRGGIGPIGYRSAVFEDSEHTVRLRIDLEKPTRVDQVVLVPTITRSPIEHFVPDAFPESIRILDETGAVLAERSPIQDRLTRIAPHVFDFPAQPVSSVVVEASRLSPRAFDGNYLIQLAEILVFSGPENVALGRKVQPSSIAVYMDSSTPWHLDFLTDGSLPYLMNKGGAPPSRAYLSPRVITHRTPLELSVDLGRQEPLSEIHLHMVDQSDTVPQAEPDGIGMPRHLRVEGANRPDFSDARPLVEMHGESVYDFGPVMMWRFPEALCRYVRLLPVRPFMYRYTADVIEPRIGFAEVALFARGTNVAAGKPFSTPGELNSGVRPASALSDERNIFGRILPLREWMGELARRHDLETLRPGVSAELNLRYTRQQASLRIMSWVAALLVGMVVIIILIDRNIRQRVAFKTREQIAADLHDELGANLHAMGLLSDLALAARSKPHKLDAFLKEMRSLTRQTGEAARHCTNLLEVEEFYDDPIQNMERAARRLLADLDHRLTVEGSEHLTRLSPRRRLDLFLFYKECLTNILRHSDATEACSRLVADKHTVTLTVSDNGQGLSQNGRAAVPASLRRRARLMRAQVKASPNGDGGTLIHLQMRSGLLFNKRRKHKHEKTL